MKEQHLYIPPDVGVATTGQITNTDWPKVYRFGNKPDRILLSFTGMGMPDITYITQSGPDQPGETILDFVLEPRYIQYTHARKAGCTRMDYWDARQNIGSLLSPARQSSTATNYMLGRLRVVLPNGAMRDIDATIENGPAFEARDPNRWMETTFIENLRFRCPDPTFYDPVQVVLTWVTAIYDGLIFYEAGTYDDHLTFPDNMLFGTDAIFATTSLTYTGTWFAYPTITITGPIASPTLLNNTLGHKICLNYNVSAGETVTITTQYGKKKITNNYGDWLMGTLSIDSSMKFLIGHDPWAPGGVNDLEFYGSGATVNTQVSLAYNTRYIMI